MNKIISIRHEITRQKIEQKLWNYQDMARIAIILGNIDSVIYATKCVLDMEKTLSEFDKIVDNRTNNVVQ